MIEETVKIIEDDEIGRVSFIRKPSVRNLKITLRPFKGVQVTVPYFVSFERASRFVEEKRSWIRQSQRRLSQYEKKVTLFAEDTDFRTRDYALKLLRHDKATIRTVIGGGRITVLFPGFATVDDPRVQQAIRKAIIQTWRIEAKKYLPAILHQLAAKHGLTYGKVTVRDNKTRWGSCSRDNNISLNIHLMRLPAHLCEYVILHELSHIPHKHHQQSFWLYLNRLTNGRARELDRELNAYSPEVW